MRDTRALLAPRQTLVTGGWTTPAGKRALFFIQPEIDGADVQAGQVTLRTRIVELPEAALTQLGLDGLKSAGKHGSSQAILTALPLRKGAGVSTRAAGGITPQTTLTVGTVGVGLRMSCTLGIGGLSVRNAPHFIFEQSS